jgi:hypothetical protein
MVKDQGSYFAKCFEAFKLDNYTNETDFSEVIPVEDKNSDIEAFQKNLDEKTKIIRY